MKPPAASRREKKDASLMMAPMIDIIFNLLIFFLLTPTFQAQEGYLTTNLPESGRAGPPVERLKIFLEIQENDDKAVIIYLGDQREALGGYRDLLLKMRGLKAQGLGAKFPVLISPMLEVRHKWVVKAFDTAVEAGFSKIQFTIPR
ncbi:MAG: biopolymer transporter ExbD [Phycisphaerae bacterium]|jgi:biopolymer transport protein ExbD|nr:biopolymer transporter ExbD [Phycisphaerae bacterium]